MSEQVTPVLVGTLCISCGLNNDLPARALPLQERAAGFLRLVSNKFVRSLSNKSTDIVRQSTELVRRGSRNVREVASRVAAAVFPGRKKKNQPRRIADASPARPGILRRKKNESLVNPATEVQISQTGQILKMEDMMGLRKAFREMEPDQGGHARMPRLIHGCCITRDDAWSTRVPADSDSLMPWLLDVGRWTCPLSEAGGHGKVGRQRIDFFA